MSIQKSLQKMISLVLILGLLVGCSAPAIAPTPVPPTSTPTAVPTPTPRADGLSHEEAATLSSLKQVDDYPLYTMRYYGAYEQRAALSVAEGTEAMVLLADVAQGSTQWSVVYGMNSGDVNLVMGQEYDDMHTFNLSLASE